MTPYSIIILSLIISVFFLIRSEITQNKPLKYVLKPLSTLLVTAIIILSVFSQGHQGYKFLILLGMLFCFGGDIALMFESKKAFTTGLVLFLIGHIVYAMTLVGYNGYIINGFLLPAVITALGILIYIFLYPGLGNMKLQVLFYVIVISFMIHCAFSSFGSPYFTHHQALLLSIGATLFYISDVMLAINRFKISFKYNRISLAFYYAGQLFIALSTKNFIS